MSELQGWMDGRMTGCLNGRMTRDKWMGDDQMFKWTDD